MSESKELTVAERAKVALQPAANEAKLLELAATSKSIVTITNPDGYQQCHSARMALKVRRVAIEKIGKSAREDATAFSKAVISEEKRLIALIEPEERRLEGLQSEWDTARAAEKLAKEEAERARVAEIQRRLGILHAVPEAYTSQMSPERLAEFIGRLEGGLTFDYQEFSDQAEAARQTALVHLRQAHVEAMERLEREAEEQRAREAEEARRAEERAEQERQDAARRAAEEARIAEDRRRLEAERAAEEARLAEVRKRIEAEQEEQRLQAEERRIEEARRQQEERDRLEAERKEQERIAQIRQWIVDLNGPTCLTATDSPSLIEKAIRMLEESRIDDQYGEFASEAAAARARGIARLTELCNAAHAHKAEQERIARERAELERQQREQAARQAEIERQEREAREADERRRLEEAQAEERRQAEERARRDAEEHRAAIRSRLAKLSAHDFCRIMGDYIGIEPELIAARIADIPHAEWVAIAASAEQDAAA